jgi:hypothetical protein
MGRMLGRSIPLTPKNSMKREPMESTCTTKKTVMRAQQFLAAAMFAVGGIGGALAQALDSAPAPYWGDKEFMAFEGLVKEIRVYDVLEFSAIAKRPTGSIQIHCDVPVKDMDIHPRLRIRWKPTKPGTFLISCFSGTRKIQALVRVKP